MAKRKKQSQTNEPHIASATNETHANGQAMLARGAEGASRTDAIPFAAEQLVVPLLQEHLQAEKTWVEAGAVLVRKTVASRTEMVPVEAAYEEVQIERVPVGRMLAEGESAAPRQEGPTLIIPMIEEEIVVLKRRVIREELRITKQHLTRQQTVQDVVRREDIQVTADGGIELVPDNSLSAPQAG
jgi:uncharacterized protein (TIGR02271 family)